MAVKMENKCKLLLCLRMKPLRQVGKAMQKSYQLLTKLNSVVFSPQMNYTDQATAACRRS
jgi:hypothetical protein